MSTELPLDLLNPRGQELSARLSELGQPTFRLRQVQRWLFQGRAETWDMMSDLPRALREQLSATTGSWWQTEVRRHHRATDGTEKLVLGLADGSDIECVLLRDGTRRTICISTQVGCAMGCVFCASGLNGVKRNLRSAEIVEQILRLQHLLPATERLSHIVVMGMGEPLANLDELLPALELAAAPHGLNISPRRITISTVGIPAAMERLTKLRAKYNLAVSLHAPNDSLRNDLVPVNRRIGLARILAAADEYFEASGRRLTFEYVLLGGLNDQPAQARELGKLLQGRTALLNVIPYNRVAGLPYAEPQAAAVANFCQIVSQYGVNVQVRERKGDEISAACGQLRRSLALESQQLNSVPPTAPEPLTEHDAAPSPWPWADEKLQN